MGSIAKQQPEHKRGVPRPPPLSLYKDWEVEEDQAAAGRSPLARSNSMHPATAGGGGNKMVGKKLSKQMSMKETSREVKWERRRRQIHRRRSSTCLRNEADKMTDGDLDELRGSMDLGFGFDERKGGHDLCDTLPALDLYFRVNRQLSEPKMRWSTSSAPSLTATSSSPNLCRTPSAGSPRAAQSNLVEPWKICAPGENPQLVKTRLRHWAQVVACSVKHSG
ncbi:hypothetical protein ACP4OV_020409 [Aristida adscensionis]